MALGRDRDRNANLKLFGGALRLAEFTAGTLAEHAGVKRETARAFAENSCARGILERVGQSAVTDARGGRPANRYRVRPDRRAELLNRFLDIHRALVGVCAAAGGNAHDDDNHLDCLALLDSAIDALDRGDFQGDRDRIRLLEDAQISVLGAEADFRALIYSQAEPTELEQFAVRLHGAKGRLERIRTSAPDTQHPAPAVAPRQVVVLSPTVTELMVSDQGTAHSFWRFLGDWVGSFGLPAADDDLVIAEVPTLLAGMLALPRDTGGVLGPALVFARLKARISTSQLGEAVVDAIRRLPPDASPISVGRLAAVAGAHDVTTAAEPLLAALLRAQGVLWAQGEQEVRRACAMALARLSRPHASGLLEPRAAAACQYLLSMRKLDESDHVALLPAALTTRYSDTSKLLSRLAELLFDAQGSRRVLPTPFDLGALARNIALALHHNRFIPLADAIAGLLATAAGCNLLRTMTATQNRALELLDRDSDSMFVVRVAQPIAQYLGKQRADAVALRVGPAVIDDLSALLTKQTWERNAVDDGTFTGRLLHARLLNREPRHAKR